MTSGRLRFVKNAASNVVNGVSSAIFAIVLPYFFVRYFSRAEFSLWVLILQLAAYVNYLNFGFQVAIGRFVSYSLERGDKKHAEDMLAAGLQILSALGALGFVLVFALAFAFPYVFRQVDPALVPAARAALLWVGGAIAVGLPFSAFFGVFIGLQRNEIPAGITALGKFLLAVAVIIAAARTRSLVVVAEVYFVGSLVQYALQYLVFVYFCRGWHLRVLAWSRAAARELIVYCAGLSVWTLAMLLVNGLDTTIVGIFDFRAVAPYGVALSIVTFFSGTLQAISTPLIQTFTRRHAREEHQEAMSDLEMASFICAMLLFVGGSWIVSVADWAFDAWVGPNIARAAVPIFVILMVANALRYTSGPYSYYVVSTGQQRKVVLTPIFEGILNCAASIFLVMRIGAIGVAIATLIGVIFALLILYFHNMARTLPEGYSLSRFFRFAIAEPLAYCATVIIVVVLRYFFHIPTVPSVFLVFVASLPAAYRVWRMVVAREAVGVRSLT
jgi:O-antigen/teichoic acid export membrane protein